MRRGEGRRQRLGRRRENGVRERKKRYWVGGSDKIRTQEEKWCKQIIIIIIIIFIGLRTRISKCITSMSDK